MKQIKKIYLIIYMKTYPFWPQLKKKDKICKNSKRIKLRLKKEIIIEQICSSLTMAWGINVIAKKPVAINITVNVLEKEDSALIAIAPIVKIRNRKIAQVTNIR
jgi:hypothetical protein